MKTHLKIKNKSLAAEARIIRAEERKWRGTHPMRSSLHNHRVVQVRREARDSLLAYGFLRGRSYLQMEAFAYEAPNWTNVESIVKRFANADDREVMQRFAQWLEDAKAAYASGSERLAARVAATQQADKELDEVNAQIAAGEISGVEALNKLHGIVERLQAAFG